MPNVPAMIRLLAIAFFTMTAALAPAWAQNSDQDRNWRNCQKSDPIIVIPSCTTVIETHIHSYTPTATGMLSIAFVHRADAYYAKGEFDLAIADYNEAIKRSPEYNGAFNNRGMAYAAKHDYDHAIQDFSEAIRIKVGYVVNFSDSMSDSDHATVYENRGLAYIHKDKYDRAIQDFDEAIRLKPKEAHIYYNRGFAYILKNEYDRAIQDFDEAIRLKPGDADVYYNRGIAYNAKRGYNRAIADYNKSIELNPKDAYALYSRGIAERNKDDVDRAQADIAAARQIDPEIAGKVGEMRVPVLPIEAFKAQSGRIPSCESIPENAPTAERALSYVDDSLKQLQGMVPGLHGIKYEAGQKARPGTCAVPAQEKTTFILSHTGKVIAEMLHRMPNLLAKEEVKQSGDDPSENNWSVPQFRNSAIESMRRGVMSTQPLKQPDTQNRTRIYSYRIVRSQNPSGEDTLLEFRTDRHDRSIHDSADNAQSPFSVGFALTWLFFSPRNLHESRFRYLGEQRIGNRETYVRSEE